MRNRSRLAAAALLRVEGTMRMKIRSRRAASASLGMEYLTDVVYTNVVYFSFTLMVTHLMQSAAFARDSNFR